MLAPIMRFFVRLLVFWAVGMPLFYLFGLPYLMDKLDQKARRENNVSCLAQLSDTGLPKVTAENYCHCVTDGLTFAKQDLLDMVLKRPPAQLTGQMQAATEQCNVILKTGTGL